jgi:hypothetical protein
MSIEKLGRQRPSLFRKEAIAFAAGKTFGNLLDIHITKRFGFTALWLCVLIVAVLGGGIGYRQGGANERIAQAVSQGDQKVSGTCQSTPQGSTCAAPDRSQ